METISAWAPLGTGLFDTLADNAWYLRTLDGKARLYVTELGRGPPVVVLHGGSGGDFNYLVDAVQPAAQHRRFILFDQRGSVLSPLPDAAAASVTLDALVGDLDTLRIALGQEKLTIFAHSAGTLLAMRYYETHPDRVARLVLTGTFAPFTPDGGFHTLIEASRLRTRALMARPVVAAVLKAEGLDGPAADMDARHRSAYDRIVGFADFDLVHVERWRQLQGGGVFYNSRIDDAVGDSLPRAYDLRPTMSGYPIPISIIQGDQDFVDPAAKAWRSVCANIHTVPRASHQAWIDNRSAFRAALLQSLAEAAPLRPACAL